MIDDGEVAKKDTKRINRADEAVGKKQYPTLFFGLAHFCKTDIRHSSECALPGLAYYLAESGGVF